MLAAEGKAMGRLGRGWRLAGASLGIVGRDKEILLLPLASLAITAGLWASWVYAALTLPPWVRGLPPGAYYGLSFALYLIASFVVLFFNAAVVAAATVRLQGRDPALRGALALAGRRILPLLAWALVAATVGLALRVVAERFGPLGRLVAGALGLAWGLATFFVLPVLVFEEVGPLEAVRRSASLFRRTWGEAVGGSLGLGLLFLLLGLPALAGPVVGLLVAGLPGLLAGLGAALVYWLALAVVAAAAKATLLAALYRFATTGEVPGGLPRPEIAMPFGVP